MKMSKDLKNLITSGLFLGNEITELPSNRSEWVGKYLIKPPKGDSRIYSGF